MEENQFGWGLVFMGTFALFSIGMRWKWFMNIFRVQLVYKILGNVGGMIFYVILSLTLIIVGVLVIAGVIR